MLPVTAASFIVSVLCVTNTTTITATLSHLVNCFVEFSFSVLEDAEHTEIAFYVLKPV